MKRLRLDILLATAFMMLIAFLLAWNVISFLVQDTISISSSVDVKVGHQVRIETPKLEKYDRVYLIFNANMPVSRINIEPGGVLIQLPLDIEGSPHDITYPTILNRGFFFIANSSGSALIVLEMQPKIPYAVKVCEGSIDSTIFNYEKKYIGVRMKAINFTEAGYAQLLLIRPYNVIIEPDFYVEGVIKVLSGRISYVNLILMAEEGWYAFRLASSAGPNSTINFIVNAGSRELFGRDVLGLRVLFMAFGIGLYKEDYNSTELSEAVVALGKLRAVSGGKEVVIEPIALDEYKLEYRLFIFRKFKPTMLHVVLVAALVFDCCTLLYLVIRAGRKYWRR